jgi:predicted oxidoreductase
MTLSKVPLHKNGPFFSPIVAGCMRLGEWGANYSADQMREFIEQCVENGVTTFDHADIYGHYSTEALFGEALKQAPHLKDEIEVVTKCGIKLPTDRRPDYKIAHYDISADYIIWSADKSLKDLNLDVIDLLLIHRPSPLMHPDVISEAITKLKADGKVKHFGVSNFTSTQMSMMRSRMEPMTNQIEASLLHTEPFVDGSLDDAIEHHYKPMIWSPFGGGALFNPGSDNENQEQINRIEEALHPLREKYECSTDQLLLAWLLKHPSKPVPVLGTSKADRVESAIHSLSINLDRQDWFILYEAARGRQVD